MPMPMPRPYYPPVQTIIVAGAKSPRFGNEGRGMSLSTKLMLGGVTIGAIVLGGFIALQK